MIAVDMSVVEKESEKYYRQALGNGSHTAVLVYNGDKIPGTGGSSFFW